MTLALTLVASYDPTYLRITDHLVRRDITAGRTPVVLDITPTSPAPVESYHRRTLHLFGVAHPGHDLAERMAELGVQYLDVRTVLASAPEKSLTDAQQEQLDIAIESALITYYRTDIPRRSVRRIGKLAHALAHEGREVFSAVSHVLAQREFEVVNLPNGRFPAQKMAMLAAVGAGVSTIHYEKGETPAGAYVQPYAPQNRLVSQAAVADVLAGMTDAQIEKVADEWLARRAPSATSSNSYSANWVDQLPAALRDRPAGQKLIGFFTSSQDEFLFLGKEWHLHEWESQFDAFDRLLTYYESQGALCYLRIHPNLATKAHDCFLRERADLDKLAARHPNLVVIAHDEPVSSYALVASSDGVVVWYSTLGLEANARGIPVWTCAVSRYGEVADIREVFSTNDITDEMLTPWRVDTLGAKKYIAYLVLRDEQMDMTLPSWEPWAGQKRPVALTPAAVLVSGGNPSIRDAITATIDTWRHRNSSFNRASISAKRAKK